MLASLAKKLTALLFKVLDEVAAVHEEASKHSSRLKGL
jgi:hypothetical protein